MRATSRAALSRSGDSVASALVPNLKRPTRDRGWTSQRSIMCCRPARRTNQANVRRSTQQSLDNFKDIIDTVMSGDACGGTVLIAGGIATSFRLHDLRSRGRKYGFADCREISGDGRRRAIVVRHGRVRKSRTGAAADVGCHQGSRRCTGRLPFPRHLWSWLANVTAAIDAGVRLSIARSWPRRLPVALQAQAQHQHEDTSIWSKARVRNRHRHRCLA